MRAMALAVIASASLAIAAPSVRAPVPAAAPKSPSQLAGWPLYDRLCLSCHGAAGDGRGPAAAFTWGRPRDFTKGVFKWRSTSSGQPPTYGDLRTTIEYGAPGTSMPGFGSSLTSAQIDELVDVVRSFGPPLPTPMRYTILSLGMSTVGNAAARGAKLWNTHGCASCHGASGRGDVAGISDPPYDLTALPLKRPRPSDDEGDRRIAVARTIVTGLAGTPMPGYADSLRQEDVWALASYVVELGARAARTDRSALDPSAIDADRTSKLAVGIWPGTDAGEAAVFGSPIAEQGTAPSTLAPAQASLRQAQCARCHAKQAREWRTSVHSRASVWGLPARELDHATDGASCARCHTPLAEQQPTSTAFDAGLRDEGVTCAACHVRGWVRRGPPRPAPSLLPLAGYPLVELALYERSDFCMSCHQLPPRTAVRGKPLLNTYKEWLESPYAARGIQCQHCHMPNREHTWLGIHDRETFRQGIKLDARTERNDRETAVVVALTNIGAGHYLPTTPTPAVLVQIELFDKKGVAITGARAELRIGRDVESTAAGWQEHSDTRIAPGEQRIIRRGWKGGRTADAFLARVTVEVAPEHFYERLYAKRLATKLPVPTRVAYEAALARARGARFVAEQRDVSFAVESK